MPVAVIDPQWRPGLTVPAGLARRYGPEHFEAIEPAARARLQPGPEPADPSGPLAWDLLYWNEPELYDRLTEGGPLHPDLLAMLPLTGGPAACATRSARARSKFGSGPWIRLWRAPRSFTRTSSSRTFSRPAAQSSHSSCWGSTRHAMPAGSTSPSREGGARRAPGDANCGP